MVLEMGIELMVVRKPKPVRMTVYSDLIELGMEPRIRSNAMADWKGYRPKPSGHRRRTIYERFSIDEILAIAKRLFRREIRLLHPDVVGGRLEEFVRIVESYRHLQRVLILKEGL